MTTQSSHTIAIEDQPSQDDVDVVREGLYAFNRLHAPDDSHQGLVLFVRRQDGSVAGGLLGETYWDWLHVGILWVDEALRGQGYGTKLLALAEAEALRRGCRAAYLDTLDFQALPFYERLGYNVWGTLSDFPPGHSRYWVKRTWRRRKRRRERNIDGNVQVHEALGRRKWHLALRRRRGTAV